MFWYVVWIYSGSGDSGIVYLTDSLEDACQHRQAILTPRTMERRFDVRIAKVAPRHLYSWLGVTDEHAESMCPQLPAVEPGEWTHHLITPGPTGPD